MQFRDRVKELRKIRAADLRANSKNWRVHGKAQRAALKRILEDVGFAGAVLAYEVDGELRLIDGHLRTETADPDQLISVLVLDVNEVEADKLLATLDPIAAMATANAQALGELLGEIDRIQPDLDQMLIDMVEAGVPGLSSDEDDEGDEGEAAAAGAGDEDSAEESELEQSLQVRPGAEYVLVLCKDAAEWEQLKAFLDLQLVRRGGYKAGSDFDAISTERVIKASRLFAKYAEQFAAVEAEREASRVEFQPGTVLDVDGVEYRPGEADRGHGWKGGGDADRDSE